MADLSAARLVGGRDLDKEHERIRRHDWRMSVGGKLTGGSGTFLSSDPATEEEVAEVPDASAADVSAAVDAGLEGFRVWRRVAPRDRARIVREMAQIVRDNAEELAVLDAIDSGNPFPAMVRDVGWAADLMEIAADSALQLTGQTIPVTTENLHFTVREPFGVVGRIIPFNHPALFTASKIAPPLVAGNAVVLKAPPQTPLAPLRLGELFQDVLPKGVLSIVTGSGVEPGDALVRHPAVKRIAFIGSVGTGRAIQRAASEAGVKQVSLELGGKNPLVVMPDADIDAAADAAVRGMNFKMSQGQSCGSTSRLIVHRSIHDDVLERVVERVEAIRVGHPLEEGVEMGPLVSELQHQRTLRYIQTGRDEGARLVTGGGRPEGRTRGWFVAPTVFAGVEPSMTIAREEIFGPVLSVLTFDDEAEALELANAVEYGLTASIWTNDVRCAHRFAREVEAGYVWINEVARHFWGSPFGGYKSSGIGREEGPDEVLSFTQLKTVHVMVGD